MKKILEEKDPKAKIGEGKGRILILEDNTSISKVLKSMLNLYKDQLFQIGLETMQSGGQKAQLETVTLLLGFNF